MMLDNLGVKRVIALVLVLAYVGLLTYGMIANKNIPDSFIGILGLVIGYYFSKDNSVPEVKSNI